VLAKNNVQLTADDIRRAGKSATFVREGDYRGAEWCGACFDPTGRILFANVYSPGFTVAISGPWAAGNL
jgi:secreted PhoX family phosphatase